MQQLFTKNQKFYMPQKMKKSEIILVRSEKFSDFTIPTGSFVCTKESTIFVEKNKTI